MTMLTGKYSTLRNAMGGRVMRAASVRAELRTDMVLTHMDTLKL